MNTKVSSKEEERNAVKKIQKIVDSVGGTNSYIGMTLDGVWGMIENNIVDDFGFSVNDLKKEIEDHDAMVLKLAKQIAEMELKAYYNEKSSIEQQERYGLLEVHCNEIKEELRLSRIATYEERSKYNAYSNEIEELNKVIDSKDQEIINLKAKLYDKYQ